MAKGTIQRRESLYCPICGAFSRGRADAFLCPECGLDMICPEHRDEQLKVCSECSVFIRTDAFERVWRKLVDETPSGMVLVSPGNFTMGRDDGEANSRPSHVVRLPAYYIDEKPVTHAEFKRFKPEHEIPEGFENEPITEVSWIEARAFSQWSGKRLPTQAEWEKAVRGVNGTLYPWGNTELSHEGMSAEEFASKIRSMSISSFGVRDGIGGIREWVEDWYQPYPENTEHDQSYGHTYKVLKGGIWTSFKPLSPADRRHALPDERPPYTGFRCVKNTSVVLDFDIREERDRERRRVQALLDELKREKALRDKAREDQEYSLRSQRIAEIQEELDHIEEARRIRIAEPEETFIRSKLAYFFTDLWESIGRITSSRRDFALQVVKIAFVVVIIAIFFMNYFITEKVAFTIRENGESYVAAMSTKGRNLRIFKEMGPASNPVLSRDAGHIAFVSSRDGNPEVYIATKNGKRITNISNNPGRDFHPRFGPDGKVMWISERGGGVNIFKARIDGSDLEQVTTITGNMDWFDISPSGRLIVGSMVSNDRWEIFTVKIDGMGFARIGDPEANNRNPLFGRREKRILFASDKDGNYELYYMNVDGTDISRVTYTIEDEIGHMAFSENGKWIYFARLVQVSGEASENRLYRMRWDGSHCRILSETNAAEPSLRIAGFKRFIAHMSKPSYVPKIPKWKNSLVDGGEGREHILRAKTRWSRDGLMVSAGDYVILKAYGRWRTGEIEEDSWVEPEGRVKSKYKGSPLETEPAEMLIAKIGDNPPFKVGEKQSFISGWEGEISFMMNDSRGMSDNEGVITVQTELFSNKDIITKPIAPFQLLKYFGFDDLIRSGMSSENFMEGMKFNMVFLSLDRLQNPSKVIKDENAKSRAVILEPSSLYFTGSRGLGDVLRNFKESFGDEGLPPFAFYLPKKIPEVSQVSEAELISVLRKYFPGRALLKGISAETLSEENQNVVLLGLYDGLVVDLPSGINSRGEITPLRELAWFLEIPVTKAREKIPEKPLLMVVPIGATSTRKQLTSQQIEYITSYCDHRPNVIGVIIRGNDADNDQKIALSKLSDEITSRKPLVKGKREKVKPVELSRITIGGKTPFKGNYKGLALADDNHLYTTDRISGSILKIAPDGSIVARSNRELPTGEILDDVLGLYVDRHERVILLDGHPGYVVFFDELLDFADLYKLPGEEPGGVAGIVSVVRDKENNFYTISSDGCLLQKFDKNFVLIKYTGGISPEPGYFLNPSDIAVSPQGDTIYVADRSKPYIQVFNSDLELKSFIPLPLRESFFNPIPLFIVCDDAGSIYIAEKRTRNIYRYSPTGELVSYFELPSIPSGGIIIIADGRFYTILDNEIVCYSLTPLKFNEDGNANGGAAKS